MSIKLNGPNIDQLLNGILGDKKNIIKKIDSMFENIKLNKPKLLKNNINTIFSLLKKYFRIYGCPPRELIEKINMYLKLVNTVYTYNVYLGVYTRPIPVYQMEIIYQNNKTYGQILSVIFFIRSREETIFKIDGIDKIDQLIKK